MMRSRARFIPASAALLLAAPPAARANDFMFSEVTAPIIFNVFLVWLAVGWIVSLSRPGLTFIRPSGILGAIVVGLLLDGHPESAACLWLIYLALLNVYYLFPRPEVTREDRMINLSIHGPALAVVLVGGGAAKILYYRYLGDFSEWSATAKRFIPTWLFLFGFFTLLVLNRFYKSVIEPKRALAKSPAEIEQGERP